jgi:hypothetical protein
MNNAERIHKLIIEKKLLDVPENRFANGEVNWNFLEADIFSEVNDDDDNVLGIKLIGEDIDTAFDMIDEPSSDILTLNDRKGV